MRMGMMSAFQAEDDRTSGEEEQRLEEGVCDQVEHPSHVRAHPHSRNHEAELGNGGVGQDFLDIVLTDCNRRGEERRPCTDHCNDILRLWDECINRRRTSDEVHARGHHRRGMDEGRDRALDPPSRLAARCKAGSAPIYQHTHQHKQCDRNDHPRQSILRSQEQRRRLHRIGRAEIPEHQEASDEETEVTDAVGDEGFLGALEFAQEGRPKRIHLVPEADQQEGAQAHAFPTDEEHQVGVA
jgi:hypothetical protein